MREKCSRPRLESPTRDMSKQLVNIHDAFFKQALSDPQLAGTFLPSYEGYGPLEVG